MSVCKVLFVFWIGRHLDVLLRIFRGKLIMQKSLDNQVLHALIHKCFGSPGFYIS